MNDIQTHLDKIRSDAAECVLLSNLVPGKREVFARTAEHLNALALEVQKTMAKNNADEGPRGENVRPRGREEVIAANMPSVRDQQALRPRQTLPWLFVIVLSGIVGIIFWASNPVKEYWSFQSINAASPPLWDEKTQAVSTLLASEQADRKKLKEQLSALVVRVDVLATALDNLQAARAGASTNVSVGAEEKTTPVAEAKPSALQEKSVQGEENATSGLESPAATKQLNDVPRGNPLTEPVDRVGAIPVPPRRAELAPLKSTIGPIGCTQFRSFDPVSGTYTTLDGRRRQCRQ